MFLFKALSPILLNVKHRQMQNFSVLNAFVEKDLANWKGCPRPPRKLLEGRYVRLEPLNAALHGDDLYKISSGEEAKKKFQYLWEHVEDRKKFDKWLLEMEKSEDPIMYAVIDKETGLADGRQSLWNIDEYNGVFEFGHVLRGPVLARKPGSTEAHFLVFQYLFDDLGYRSARARTHHENVTSQTMIQRMGMKHEGIMRQHAVKKGRNQDSYIYSMMDREWPLQKLIISTWLNANNFDKNGKQIRRMEDIRHALTNRF